MNKQKQLKRERNKLDKEWRLKVLERDDYKCVICGKKERVNIHHLIPRSNKKLRWDIMNLIALCPLHHRFSYEISPHQNPIVFLIWLIDNRKEQFEYLKEKIVDKNEKNL